TILFVFLTSNAAFAPSQTMFVGEWDCSNSRSCSSLMSRSFVSSTMRAFYRAMQVDSYGEIQTPLHHRYMFEIWLLDCHRELLMEILTVDEVATMLNVSKWHVYELAKPRTKSGDIRKQPLPSVRL